MGVRPIGRGKSPKHRQRRMKRGGFEEAARLAAPPGDGNRNAATVYAAMLMAGQMHPPFLFWSCQKRNGPCTVQREKTLWSQLCTSVQSCCTGVGVSVPAPILPGLRARYPLLRFLRLPSRGGEYGGHRGGYRIVLLLFPLPLPWRLGMAWSHTRRGGPMCPPARFPPPPGRGVGAVINRPFSRAGRTVTEYLSGHGLENAWEMVSSSSTPNRSSAPNSRPICRPRKN